MFKHFTFQYKTNISVSILSPGYKMQLFKNENIYDYDSYNDINLIVIAQTSRTFKSLDGYNITILVNKQI